MISCSCSANPISKSLGGRREGRGQGAGRSGEGLPPVSSHLQPPSPPPHFSHVVGVCLNFSLSDNFILSNNDLEILGLICSVSYKFALK